MQTVIETGTYLSSAKANGVSDDERRGIIDTLAANPSAGDPMVGTGGARKVRYAREGTGKSGGYRVITYFAAADVPVFLLDIFGKGDKANLTKAERNELAKVLPQIAPAYRASTKAAAAAKRKGQRK